jgi:hypothetical protein
VRCLPGKAAGIRIFGRTVSRQNQCCVLILHEMILPENV